MKRESVLKNYIFQFAYQIVILVIPLIMSPYLTRTLGKTGLGVYTYANSIAYYFTLIAMLGISRYGQRVISASADDEITLRRKFWSLYTVHSIFSILAIALYALFVMIFVHENKVMFQIQIIYVASALFNVTWLFQGLENFSNVVVKNFVIQVSECILILAFVKNPDDITKYSIIATGALLMGQFVMIPKAFSAIKPIRFSIVDMREHLKPLFILAITIVAAALYTVFDKTLLGILTTVENVALYEYANKIIKIPQTFISVAGTVLYPRACYMFARGDELSQKRYFDCSLLITFFIGMGSAFGLLAVGKMFATIYYGVEFSECGPILMSMTPLILIIGVGEALRTQYMIPRKMDKEFAICLSLNAIINLILSTLLIPHFGIYGAVIGTTAAEIFGLCYQLRLCRGLVSCRNIIRKAISFATSGVVMFAVLSFMKKKLSFSIQSLLIEIVVGIIIFSIVSLIYICKYEKDFMNALLGQNKREKVKE